MTPSKLDWQSVRAKIRKISDQLADLAGSQTPYADSFPLAAKAGLLDKDLAERLRPSAGLRNILVHEYTTIDYQRVVDAIPAAIEKYGRYVEQVARWLLERQKASGTT
jgi:uncharacterized protein YutE (UPF0331/DUF86 family)